MNQEFYFVNNDIGEIISPIFWSQSQAQDFLESCDDPENASVVSCEIQDIPEEYLDADLKSFKNLITSLAAVKSELFYWENSCNVVGATPEEYRENLNHQRNEIRRLKSKIPSLERDIENLIRKNKAG